MIYFRAGCIALFFITIPALASEVRDVPEGNRVFWFVVFPVTFLMFPVLFGALFSRNYFFKEYVIIAMSGLITQLVFIACLYSFDYFKIIMVSGLVQSIVPSMIYAGISVKDETKIARTSRCKVCIGGASIVVTVITWFFLKLLFDC